MGRHQREDRLSRNVSLLISMLVRYPEVGTVKYDPRQQTLRLGLLIRGSLSDEEVGQLRRRVVDTVEVYNLLQQRQPSVIELACEGLGQLTSVAIVRDVATMTPEEIWTLIELFREWSPERLVVEFSDPVAEDEIAAQDEMIEEVLTELEGGKSGRDLIAIREDGRVMVFRK